jgi:predicted DCC family thiol-disulfide oxidoreductase YuxK
MMSGPSTSVVAPRSLTVWYDGDCPICSAEISLIRRLDRAFAIEFVDLSLPGGCPTDRATRLARLHAQPSDGGMVSGAAAFVAMWRVLPNLRPLAALASPPPILWLLERAYLGFLRVRPSLQAAARWLIARRSAGPRS